MRHASHCFMARYISTIASSVLLAACATNAPQPAKVTHTKPVISLAEAKRIILAERGRLWRDPDSIKDARIGQPYLCHAAQITKERGLHDAPASCVCVELNARNAYGGYVGLKGSTVSFPEYGNPSAEGIAGDHCRNFTPFPELNGRRR